MRAFLSVITLVTLILMLLNGIILIGTTIELLKGYIGVLAYIGWIIVAPILSPSIFALPWFDAWVAGSHVSPAIFWIWLSWIICIVIRILLAALGVDSGD